MGDNVVAAEAAEVAAAEAATPHVRRATVLATVPRLLLRPEEAAAAIGVSRSHFFQHVLPELRVVQSGRLRLVPVRELERWAEKSAARFYP